MIDRRNLVALFASACLVGTAEAGRMLKGRAGGSPPPPPPPPAPEGQMPSTPFVLAQSSGVSGSSPTATVTHVVQAVTLYADGTTTIASAVTYRNYFGTVLAEVAAGPDGPITPTTSSSPTTATTGQSSGTKYTMTNAVVDSVEGYGMLTSYSVP